MAVIERLFAPEVVGRRALDREAVHERARPHRRQPDRQGRGRHGAVGHHRPQPRQSGHRPARGLYRPDAREPHARVRRPGRDGGGGAADPGHLRHHDVQGEGRPAALPPRRRRLPGAARGPRPGRRAVHRRQPRLERVGVGPRAAGDGRPRPDLRRGTVPRRRCAGPALAGRARAPSRSSPTRAPPGPPRSPAELLGGSATAISIKTARTGFTASQRVLHQCEGLGVEVVMGNQIDGQIGTLCAVAFGAAHRHASRRAGELSNFLDMADDLLAEPLQHRATAPCASARAPGSASTSTRPSSPATARTAEQPRHDARTT